MGGLWRVGKAVGGDAETSPPLDGQRPWPESDCACPSRGEGSLPRKLARGFEMGQWLRLQPWWSLPVWVGYLVGNRNYPIVLS